jgi:hypothetical protein
MTTPAPISSFPGYEDVADLIPDGSFLRCTDLWRMTLEHYRDELGALNRRLVLELTSDRQTPTTERVAVIMESPVQIRLPDPTSCSILGLAMEDVRERGWEETKWRVYDYEMSGLDLFCTTIRFERRKDTEPGASPNGGPGRRLGNSEAGGGPPSVS